MSGPEPFVVLNLLDSGHDGQGPFFLRAFEIVAVWPAAGGGSVIERRGTGERLLVKEAAFEVALQATERMK